MPDTMKIDPEKSEAFAERMLDLLNDGGLALMLSVGHRTGLLDTLADLPPSTAGEIAAAAELNERYVREWLGAMVTGGILEHDPGADSYHLPPEHAAWTTRAAGPDNVAAFTQYIAVLAGVEDGIVECFRNGGGVPYSEFPRFQEVMAEDSSLTVETALLDDILPLVPGLPADLESGIDVLDVGCGSGRAMNLMAATYPNSRFAGYDISEEGIAAAERGARERGVSNSRFEVRDVATLDEPAGYDLITAFDAIHDQVRPQAVLDRIAAALRPDGTFLMQDIAGSSHVHENLDHPMGPILYTVSCMHCMTVSLAENGAGLGAMWGEEKAREMLADAGFGNVRVERLPHDIQNSYYVARK